ncbi:MAG: ATP-dependent DNA helicase RecG, partial [Thermoanaerobaculia bacterium]
MTFDAPIRTLKGVGDARAKALEESGLATVNDLLWFFPFRYEDRRHPTRIADIGQHVDRPVLVRGRVVSAGARLSPIKRMRIFEAVLEDGSGAVKLVFF